MRSQDCHRALTVGDDHKYNRQKEEESGRDDKKMKDLVKTKDMGNGIRPMLCVDHGTHAVHDAPKQHQTASRPSKNLDPFFSFIVIIIFFFLSHISKGWRWRLDEDREVDQKQTLDGFDEQDPSPSADEVWDDSNEFRGLEPTNVDHHSEKGKEPFNAQNDDCCCL